MLNKFFNRSPDVSKLTVPVKDITYLGHTFKIPTNIELASLDDVILLKKHWVYVGEKLLSSPEGKNLRKALDVLLRPYAYEDELKALTVLT